MMPKESILLTSFLKISLDVKGIGYGMDFIAYSVVRFILHSMALVLRGRSVSTSENFASKDCNCFLSSVPKSTLIFSSCTNSVCCALGTGTMSKSAKSPSSYVSASLLQSKFI